jgi:hypothetical protein
MTLNFFSVLAKPKTVLVLPVAEVNDLIKRPHNEQKLVKFSEGIAKISYGHFAEDQTDLLSMKATIQTGSYPTYGNLVDSIGRRLQIMSCEIADYGAFSGAVRHLEDKSQELEAYLAATNTMVGKMRVDIADVKRAFGRRVY